MATGVMTSGSFVSQESSEHSLWTGIKKVLEPAASLKLTVVLFALSIFLILAGTFAQVDKDIWEVIGLYFRCWFAWVPFQVFFPPSFFPDDPLKVSGGQSGLRTSDPVQSGRHRNTAVCRVCQHRAGLPHDLGDHCGRRELKGDHG